MSTIKFGTSGWRAIIADEFTFKNVRVAAQSICDVLSADGMHNHPVIVGYDTRFLADEFALTVAQVLAANGIEARLCQRDTPTPVVAFEVIREKAAGGVVLTASHNPFAYCGLKFNTAWGGPALPEITARIELGCEPYISGDEQPKSAKEITGLKKRLIVPADPMPAYFKQLESIVDVPLLKKSKLKVVTDAVWGTGRGYLDEFLRRCGMDVSALRTNRDVLYGGGGPTPERHNLDGLYAEMKRSKAVLGLATDGDADRFGIMDVDGTVLSPNEFLPLLLDHLVKTRGWKTGVVVRSVMTSHFLDAVAKKHGLELKETPVGFKYIGEIMQREGSIYPSKGGNFILGGEESGGLTIKGHVPEKDGVLACLLAAEIAALTKKPLRKSLEALQKEVGVFLSDRLNFHLPAGQMSALKSRLRTSPPTRFPGFAVRRIVETDGYKFLMTDGSWMGVRLSGTEPVVRVYTEANDKAKLKMLEKAGRELAGVK
jgi:alpha-D-glucose phosphate-specific phosphoglucomutase